MLIKFRDNGLKLDEGTFQNGKLHGFAKCYYAIKETLFYCGTYNNGMRQGYGAEYYENGKMKKGGEERWTNVQPRRMHNGKGGGLNQKHEIPDLQIQK